MLCMDLNKNMCTYYAAPTLKRGKINIFCYGIHLKTHVSCSADSRKKGWHHSLRTATVPRSRAWKTLDRRKIVSRSGSQWFQIRAPDHNKFVGRFGNKWAWIRAFDRRMFLCRSRSIWHLIRAPERWMFVTRSESQWALIRAPDHRKFVGRFGNQWVLIRARDR